MSENWLEIAKRRWTNCPVQGSGRYAIAVLGANSGRTQRVILVEDEATQKAACLGYDRCERYDLSVDGYELLARIPDRHYERERRG
jgi:hypothetical protein